MSRRCMDEAVPTVVLHMVAAGMNGFAAYGLGAPANGVLMAGLALGALAGPVAGLALSVAGRPRAGALLLLLSYVATAGLGLYSLLVLGALSAALGSPAGAPWRLPFFATAALLPLLQIKGILEMVPWLVSHEAPTKRVA